MKARVTGTSRKWPNDPKAVAVPNAIERRFESTSLPIDDSTTANEAADMPSPTMSPPPVYSPAAPSAFAMTSRPPA